MSRGASVERRVNVGHAKNIQKEAIQDFRIVSKALRQTASKKKD